MVKLIHTCCHSLVRPTRTLSPLSQPTACMREVCSASSFSKTTVVTQLEKWGHLLKTNDCVRKALPARISPRKSSPKKTLHKQRYQHGISVRKSDHESAILELLLLVHELRVRRRHSSLHTWLPNLCMQSDFCHLMPDGGESDLFREYTKLHGPDKQYYV